jgi:hypothetical protein
MMKTTETFPYPTFPIRLEYKDVKEKRVCFFECKEHLDKYLKRHNLKKNTVNIQINVPD